MRVLGSVVTTNYISHEILGARMALDFCTSYKFSKNDTKFIVETIDTHLKDDCWLKPFDDAGKLK